MEAEPQRRAKNVRAPSKERAASRRRELQVCAPAPPRSVWKIREIRGGFAGG